MNARMRDRRREPAPLEASILSFKTAAGTLFAVALLLSVTVASAARDDVRISEPSETDLLYMAQQRESLNALAQTKLGRQFNGTRSNDLAILQLLLDRRLVRPDETRQLQAMGVIMGDLLADDLDMHWVIYEDSLGRSRALRYRQSDEYLFPITMIARRQEADNHTPVARIYQKAHDIIAPLKPALPFQ
jgi:hypothetical protein